MAFTSKPTLLTRVADLIQNEKADIGLSEDSINAAIDRVVASISLKVSAYVAWHYLDGTGSAFRLPIANNLTSWSTGFSRIKWIEYPLGQQVPQYIPLDEIALWPTAEAPTHVQFQALTPASGTDNVGVAYTAIHLLTDTTSTIPDSEEAGYEYACAADALLVYAALYSHSTRPSLDADSVNGATQADIAMRLGEKFLEKASREFGVDLTGVIGSGGDAGGPSASAWANPQPTFGVWGSPIIRSRRQH